MKKIIIALTVLTGIVAACAPKPSSVAVGSADAGKAIIDSEKCTRCHHGELKYISNHTFEEQEKLLLNMAGKAKLTWAETQDLMTYVIANAKK